MNKNRIILVLSLLSICIYAGFARAEKALVVSFLDIGQGDAIYIEAPNGNQMIIDGGPGHNLSHALSDIMPYGDRSINVLMVTNPDTDHYAGFLDVLKEYDIGAVIEPGTVSHSKTYEKLEQSIATENIPELIARKGMTIDLDREHGVRFTVLFPDRDVHTWSTNDGSIEGILSYGKTKIFFTGDGTKKTEGIIISGNTPDVIRSDILKVPHHGSATSSGESFVKTIAPKWAVISAGAGNTYGLPKQVTLDTLSRNAIDVIRTDREGTITFTSNGIQFVRVN